MAIDDTEGKFEQLYLHVDGYAISKKAISKLSRYYSGYMYGEITYRGFLRMLAMARPKKNEVFYDLGSGTGKVVILAAMLANFSKVVGVEIFQELLDASQKVLDHYKELSGLNNSFSQSVVFIHGNFNDVDFSEADVIFMNATAWSYEFGVPFIRKLEQLKKGARIITSTLVIKSNKFKINPIGSIDFSWGDEEVFIHEKI
ncbi:hypothetical protein COY90_03195 [Candidatus Roizmanbacteria bacterium CG_4_10_14_0_8_um_filter_39_9]|uniref:Histone-lysine N-methyltransferase, H3 lysine-79 specific n=1 Tax=Candidatus Roizmanbacteria bacterium CG_4_10_14_0_8_um_filter_39_9 TaxID=1974829 RepID=A0A2M7QDJ9_9BACT|nr:MAG: hypothetical protein COY90_03195 [Candidatus Roizmanbacteria bacterium CG_4_10_14_0_8_um_filter_39_9]